MSTPLENPRHRYFKLIDWYQWDVPGRDNSHMSLLATTTQRREAYIRHTKRRKKTTKAKDYE